MTTQNLTDRNELAQARRTRPGSRARLADASAASASASASAAVGAAASAAAEQGRWLTAILRPAGTLDRAALRGLSESLAQLATSSNMIIVDLTAAVVSNPRAFARDLLAPARTFEQAGQCLLLLGASPEMTAALDRYAVPVVTLAADAMPLDAA